MPFEKRRSRATKITKTRKYRITKRRARRPRAILRIDRGTHEQEISLVFPEAGEKTRFSEYEIPKERNPNLVSLKCGTATLAVYLDDQKQFEQGFVYDKDGIYCASFEKHDLKNLFKRIGDLLKRIKNKKG